MAIKLQERAAECTPGFHNGVNAMVDSFYSAKSMNDLLYRVRNDIVSRTANQLTDEVHANNRVFVVAEDSGYGVHALNREDRYVDHMSGEVPNDKIKEALKNAFEKELNLFPMLQGLEDQLRGQLGHAGYEGLNDTGYPYEEQDEMETSLKKLFKDAPVVVELQEAQTALDEQKEVKKELENTAKKALQELGLGFTEGELNLYLNPESARLLPQLITNLKAKVDQLAESQQESLKKIKLEYTKKRDSFDKNVSTRLTDANDAFKTKFFFKNESDKISDINWPNLREMIWQRVNEQQYFTFKHRENVHLDALMNPQTPKEAFNNHFTAMLNLLPPQDVIQLLNHSHPSDDVGQQALSKYNEKLPASVKYDLFKAILRSLDNTEVKNGFIQIQHKQLIKELKDDIPTLMRVISFMSLQEISEYLSDETLQSQLLEQAILEHPQSVQPLMKSLATLPDNIQVQILGSNKEIIITAAKKRQVDVVRALLTSDKIDPNQADVNGNTALMHAVSMRYADVVKALLADARIKPNQATHGGSNPFFAAVAMGDVEVVEALVADGRINPNQALENGFTPFLVATREGHADVVKVLLADRRIDPNQAEKNGKTAFMLAVENAYVEVVTALLADRRIDPNQADEDGRTALMFAVEYGYVEVVTALLADPDHRIDPNQASKNGRTPIFTAVINENIEMVTALLTNDKIDPNQADKDGNSVLMTAAINGSVEMVTALLANNNIDPNKAVNGITPIFTAVMNENIEMVTALLTNDKIDPNQAIKGITPIHIAILKGYPDVVKALLANKNTKLNQAENKALSNFIKSEKDFDLILKDLSEEKTKIVIENSDGLLHQAFLDGKVDFFEALIDKGVRPTEATLSQIYSSNNIDIVGILINKRIVTPNDAILSAKDHGNTDLIQGLRDKKLVEPTEIESLRNAIEDDVERSKVALDDLLRAVQAIDDVDASFDDFDDFDAARDGVDAGFDNFDDDFYAGYDEIPQSREQNLKTVDEQSEKIRTAVNSALENYDKAYDNVKEMGSEVDGVATQALADAKVFAELAQENLMTLELALLRKVVKAVKKDVQRSKVALDKFVDVSSKSHSQAAEVRTAVKYAFQNYAKAQAIADKIPGSEPNDVKTQVLAEAKLYIGLAEDNLKVLKQPPSSTQDFKAQFQALQTEDSPRPSQDKPGQDEPKYDDKFNPKP